MKIPTSTYRIQFRNGMTFDRAAELVPYLKQLGISHLYASPIFSATAGSTHGYDVTDVNQIDPAIGGRAGFDRLVQALKAADLGLIIDIVPNHMAASLENHWWYDVIENGEKSRYARHFDIDWSRRLTLPFLGDSFENELEKGQISVQADPHSAKPALAYYESYYPLTPESWQGREAEVLNLTDKAAIAELHQRQPWRLMSWRDAPHDLSYRRFFEVTGLAGVRVEDAQVFDDTHRLILELVHSGAVDGLRVDHIDGLADPFGYLTTLRQHTGSDCYITVEKILGEGEQLAAEWPVSGTTGYEFIATLSSALVNGDKIDQLGEEYAAVIGAPVNMAAELRAAKLLMVNKNFEGEFNRLVQIVMTIVKLDDLQQDESTLRDALRELLVAFPVYRTYGTAQGLTRADQARLQQIIAKLSAGENAPDPAALAVILRIMQGEVSENAIAEANDFRTRLQQLTGPLMAKSIEDTLFYRQHSALALNEVGAEPLAHTFSLEEFHQQMKTRAEHQPDALSTTSTHDTKRGEDARARLYTLSEAPHLWAESVARWRAINHLKITSLSDGPAPEPAVEWMLYQALAGVWPPGQQPGDASGLQLLEQRFLPYVEKALREAKLRTNWADVNADYEAAVLDYARHLLSPDNQAFLQDFSAQLQPFIRAGLINSLVQTTIKLTAPGVPDIYQGSETLDLSLVDPDNRREPDFAALQQMLTGADKASLQREACWLSGQVNQFAIARLLHLRQQQPTLFSEGDYLPLIVTGKAATQVLAFARINASSALIVIAPRLMFNTLGDSLTQPPEDYLADTQITLPESLANRRYRHVLSDEFMQIEKVIRLDFVTGYSTLVLISE